MMSSSILPPGFRFHPTDQELIVHYLKKKVSTSSESVVSIIADVDLYKFNPWELPGMAFFGDSEWFFFTPRDRKYPNGVRPNRAAASGYWKATGTDKPIITSDGSQCLGVKKALVFYRGRPPQGVKTNWMMHEYRLLDDARNSHRLLMDNDFGNHLLITIKNTSNLVSWEGLLIILQFLARLTLVTPSSETDKIYGSHACQTLREIIVHCNYARDERPNFGGLTACMTPTYH